MGWETGERGAEGMTQGPAEGMVVEMSVGLRVINYPRHEEI